MINQYSTNIGKTLFSLESFYSIVEFTLIHLIIILNIFI